MKSLIIVLPVLPVKLSCFCCKRAAGQELVEKDILRIESVMKNEGESEKQDTE